MAPTSQTWSGATLGEYRVLCQLGSGGMGVVLKAFDPKLERTVALKLLAGDGEAVDANLQFLLHEARVASVLDHKNIVAIHAVEHSDEGRPFLVMAYCEGESLAVRLRGPRLPLPEAIDIAEQVGEGLAHAHAHNIVHRDIKPQNVILAADGTAKIVDFGLARRVSAEATTQTLKFAGTLSYMSPEQLSGGAVDARTDVWSLGVLLYEMLTGALPFEQTNPAASVAAIANVPPREMPGVPPAVQLIVYRALAKNPQDRYQSAMEFVHDLRALGTDRHVDLAAEIRYRAQLAAAAVPQRQMSPRAMVAWVLLGLFAILWITLVPALRDWTRHAPTKPGQHTTPAAHESYLRAVAYLDRWDKPGNLDAAVREFQATATKDPKFALAYAGLCESNWMKYKFESAPEQLQSAQAACAQAAALNDALPAVSVSLGRLHAGTGERELAVQEFQRALILDPHNAPAMLGLADTYAALGRKEEAERTYKQAIALRPEHWSGYYRLGGFYYRQQRYADAAEQFRKVIESVPDNGLAHAALAQMLMDMGRDAEAEPEFKRGLELAPNYGAFTNLGLMYYRQRRWAESAAMTEKALQLNDRDYRLWDNLGMSYRWLGDTKKADHAFGRRYPLLVDFVRANPDDAIARADLGFIYAGQSQRKEALKQLAAAKALASDDPAVLLRVGETYELLGDHAKGFAYLRQAVNRGYRIADLAVDYDARAIMANPRLRKELEAAQPRPSQP